jgi:pectate lyase
MYGAVCSVRQDARGVPLQRYHEDSMRTVTIVFAAGLLSFGALGCGESQGEVTTLAEAGVPGADAAADAAPEAATPDANAADAAGDATGDVAAEVEPGCQCNAGDCCDLSTCKFLPSGTACRAAAGPCDQAEQCTGSSASCPSDSCATSGSCGDGGTCNASCECVAAPAASGPIGWASVPGAGVDTTTGGGSADAVTVTTLSEFNNAASGSAARVIKVSGAITAKSGTSYGTFKVGSNKTILGLPNATLTGSLVVDSSSNVIVRDLVIQGYNCADNACGDGADAVVVRNSHHVWMDHLDISDGTDGNLDIVAGSDYVTVSWCKFHYSATRANGATDENMMHRFSNLVGSGYDPSQIATDKGKLNVTYHHNWWADRVNSRMPLVRFGKVHVFNNLYTNPLAPGWLNSTCVAPGYDSSLLVQNNRFVGIKNPVKWSSGDNTGATLKVEGNSYVNTTGTPATDLGTVFVPPYPFGLDAVDGVEAAVKAGAGPTW